MGALEIPWWWWWWWMHEIHRHLKACKLNINSSCSVSVKVQSMACISWRCHSLQVWNAKREFSLMCCDYSPRIRQLQSKLKHSFFQSIPYLTTYLPWLMLLKYSCDNTQLTSYSHLAVTTLRFSVCHANWLGHISVEYTGYVLMK